jgi:pantetheine-phosphate adenylyltransferase
MKKRKEAIYAMSADPITNGHLNIIDRMLKTFEFVLVGIGINPDKRYTFTLEEREKLTKDVLKKYGDRVSVKSYAGLLTDFAYENQIYAIVRGARNSVDFDFEKMLVDINQGLRLNLDTYILIADQTLSHISSSTVKELQKHQANNVRDYVPLTVKQALEFKISGQFLIGVTGGIGCGKSFVTKKLVEIAENDPVYKGLFHSIDMDELGRYILKDSTEDIHMLIRDKVAKAIKKELIVEGKIDIHMLLIKLFDSPESTNIRKRFEKIMEEPMTHLLRKRLRPLRGVILISSALFVESKICDLVNNNILFIECTERTRLTRLIKGRRYSKEQIENRLSAQLSPEDKIVHIDKRIKEHSCGRLIRFTNKNENENEIIRLYDYLWDMYKKVSLI